MFFYSLNFVKSLLTHWIFLSIFYFHFYLSHNLHILKFTCLYFISCTALISYSSITSLPFNLMSDVLLLHFLFFITFITSLSPSLLPSPKFLTVAIPTFSPSYCSFLFVLLLFFLTPIPTSPSPSFYPLSFILLFQTCYQLCTGKKFFLRSLRG